MKEYLKHNYHCSICGKAGVKLWRPYLHTEPLICANCAEERQALRKYNVCNWEHSKCAIVGIHTGKEAFLDKWIINDKGQIPSPFGPEPEGVPNLMTYKLLVDLRDYYKEKSPIVITLIPAIPDDNGEFFGYTSLPQQASLWWENLPTH